MLAALSQEINSQDEYDPAGYDPNGYNPNAYDSTVHSSSSQNPQEYNPGYVPEMKQENYTENNLENGESAFQDDDVEVNDCKSKATKPQMYAGTTVKRKLLPLKRIAELSLSRNPETFLTMRFPYSNPTFRLEEHVLPNLSNAIKPDLLSMLEKVHPVLIKHTDIRWKQFCDKKFATKKLLEDECYKEMYGRCLEADREKLAKLTGKIYKKVTQKEAGEKKSRFTVKAEQRKREQHWTEALGVEGSSASGRNRERSGEKTQMSSTHSFSTSKGRLTDVRKQEKKTKGGLMSKSRRQFQGSLYKLIGSGKK